MDEEFEKFRQIVFRDLELQNTLQSISEHDVFVSRVIELGNEFGLKFGESEVLLAMNDGRRVFIERWI